MKPEKIAPGVVHEVPEDLKESLKVAPEILKIWNRLTALARNEWICWIISVKKPETRMQHIKRLFEDLPEGKHRPCCWAGCPHRKPVSNGN